MRQRPGLSASDLARGTFRTRQSMQTLVEEASRVVAGVEERMLARLAADDRRAMLDGLVACTEALATPS